MKNKTRYDWIIIAVALAMVITARVQGATIIAKPGDDLQAALNAAGPNGTVQLQPGVYSVTRTLMMLNGQTIRGSTQIVVTPYVDTTTLAGFAIPSVNYFAVNESVIASGAGLHAIIPKDNCTIVGVSASGSLIWGDGQPANLIVSACWFNTVVTEGAHPTVIESSYAFRGLRIEDCVFREANYKAVDTFIYFYAFTGSIKRCQFIGGRDGIHIANSDSSTIDATVEQCHFRGMRANPVEYQGGGKNFGLLDCWQDTADYASPAALMGFTLPADRSDGTRAIGNVVLALNQSNANNRQRVGFEFSSTNISCKSNLVIGVRKPATITNAQGSGRIEQNHFEDYPEASDTNGGRVIVQNNVNAALKASMLLRGRPGPFRPYGQEPQSNPDPAPGPVPGNLLHLQLDIDLSTGKTSNVKITGGGTIGGGL